MDLPTLEQKISAKRALLQDVQEQIAAKQERANKIKKEIDALVTTRLSKFPLDLTKDEDLLIQAREAASRTEQFLSLGKWFREQFPGETSDFVWISGLFPITCLPRPLIAVPADERTAQILVMPLVNYLAQVDRLSDGAESLMVQVARRGTEEVTLTVNAETMVTHVVAPSLTGRETVYEGTFSGAVSYLSKHYPYEETRV